MQGSVEKTSELSRKMTVCLPNEAIQNKINSQLKSLARTVKIDGFRPGKVPQQVIKKRYGEQVKSEVYGDLIQEYYPLALKDQEIIPAGMPQIASAEEVEAGFQFIAEFEVYPEISLDALADVEVACPTAEVTEADVDNMLQKLREQKRQWNVVEKAAEAGDTVIMNFSGTSEDENFTDGIVKNYKVEIGGKQMIPGFEDQLIGLEAGTKKVFDINFPEGYGNKKLSGKVANFDIEVLAIEEVVIPEIDEEFIQDYGHLSGNYDSFRTEITANMNKELSKAVLSNVKNAVLEAVYKKIEVTLPKALINAEVEALMKPYEEIAKKQNKAVNDLDLSFDIFEAQAKRRVALSLILSEIIQQNDMRVDDAAVRANVEDMAQSYEDPEEVIQWHYSEEKNLNEVRQMILENQTVEWILSKVNVTEEASDFETLMEKAREKNN